MNLAIDEAYKWQILTYPNPAVGALLLDNHGKMVALTAHKEAGKPHAEVLAFKEAFLNLASDQSLADQLEKLENSSEIHDFLISNHNNIFRDFMLFVTLEPCNSAGKTPACSHLIREMKIKTVVFGANDPNDKMSGGAGFLQNAGIEVVSGVCQKRCEELIYPFVVWQKKQFVLFKWASRLNGTIDGGLISGEMAQIHTHKIRSLCDAMLIGGRTVRHDRPTLDSRKAGGKNPDIVIFSQNVEFDRNIPLFGVPNRTVTISDSLSAIENHKFVFAEGTSTLLNLLASKVDMFLVYQSSSLQAGRSISSDQELELLHIERLGSDTKSWYIKKEEL